MVKSSLCNYSKLYILFKGTITVANTAVKMLMLIVQIKKVSFENHTPFTDRTREINNAQIDNTKDMDVNVYTNANV